jgi:hypothetical protein
MQKLAPANPIQNLDAKSQGCIVQDSSLCRLPI